MRIRSGTHVAKIPNLTDSFHVKRACAFLMATLGLISPLLADLSVGQPAPDFMLKDEKGQQVSLSDFKGRFVVLEWLNYGCPFVRNQYGTGNMQKVQKEATGNNAIWLSICSSADGKQGNLSPEEISAKRKELGDHASAYLIDNEGTVGKLYGARTTPDMFVINPDGTLIYSGAIDSNPTPNPAAVAGAHNYVLAALDEARANKPVSKPKTRSYGCAIKYP